MAPGTPYPPSFEAIPTSQNRISGKNGNTARLLALTAPAATATRSPVKIATRATCPTPATIPAISPATKSAMPAMIPATVLASPPAIKSATSPATIPPGASYPSSGTSLGLTSVSPLASHESKTTQKRQRDEKQTRKNADNPPMPIYTALQNRFTRCRPSPPHHLAMRRKCAHRSRDHTKEGSHVAHPTAHAHHVQPHHIDPTPGHLPAAHCNLYWRPLPHATHISSNISGHDFGHCPGHTSGHELRHPLCSNVVHYVAYHIRDSLFGIAGSPAPERPPSQPNIP